MFLEKSATIYKSTWLNIPEDLNVHQHLFGNQQSLV